MKHHLKDIKTLCNFFITIKSFIRTTGKNVNVMLKKVLKSSVVFIALLFSSVQFSVAFTDPGCNYPPSLEEGVCVPHYIDYDGSLLIEMRCEADSVQPGLDLCYIEGELP